MPFLIVSKCCHIAQRKTCWRAWSWQEDTGRRMGHCERHQPQRPRWQCAATARGVHNIFLSPCGVLLRNPAKQHQQWDGTALKYCHGQCQQQSSRGGGKLLSPNPLATRSCCRVLPSKTPNVRNCPATSASHCSCSSKTILGISYPKGWILPFFLMPYRAGQE